MAASTSKEIARRVVTTIMRLALTAFPIAVILELSFKIYPVTALIAAVGAAALAVTFVAIIRVQYNLDKDRE